MSQTISERGEWKFGYLVQLKWLGTNALACQLNERCIEKLLSDSKQTNEFYNEHNTFRCCLSTALKFPNTTLSIIRAISVRTQYAALIRIPRPIGSSRRSASIPV